MKHIKGFDGLRFYSVILVVISHLGIASSFEKGSYLKEHVFYFISGSAGVNIFFAISGFLITTLIFNEIKDTGSFNIKFFFFRRFIRLLPPMIPFYILLFIFMKLGYVRNTSIGLFASVIYLFNFVPRAKIAWSTELSHTWSLAVEEQFYILWAFIFKFFNTKKIILIIFSLLILCIISYYILPNFNINIDGKSHNLNEIFFVFRWTIPAIGPILLGALFATLNFYDYKSIRTKFSQTKPLIYSFIIFLSPFYLPEFLMPLKSIFHSLGAVMILLWICNNQSSTIVKLLEWSPIKYIGTISYGIYIWQGFFIRTMPDATPKIWLHDSPYNVLFTFVVAVISYEFYEKKVLRLKKKYKVSKKS